MSYISRQRAFFGALDRELQLYQTNDIGYIDMFIFPVFPDDQPYIVCFDLRKELIFIIDSSIEVNKHPVSSNYNILCDILRSLPSEFLNSNREDLSSTSVAKSTIEGVDLKWADSMNTIDVVLYVMRHMETFGGDTSVNWNTRLLNATHHHLGILRMRYCAPIASWEHNKYKDDVLRDSAATYGAVIAVNSTRFNRVLAG
ncbi:uncharacterized protein LOC131019364 [Salvia miltiorrhiza]|uniref:uncharacterized protein LOC131019364 n=1 Tax=Salvia miltiorrhiza TaxID=226208 RepID=UPI0025AD1149|nr:uncharacterized protein LOC131019364 [Salvia miltiorrhiza]XP_057803881.1 uncharacterized protein LOC131019364 [Salvia miltiorrhiza]